MDKVQTEQGMPAIHAGMTIQSVLRTVRMVPLELRMLLEHTLGFTRVKLITHADHVLTEAERESVSVDAIFKFYQGTLGARVLAAKRVYREQAFELLLPAKELYPEETSEEKILLQGVIDCYFEEPDGIVLIDYKSDYYTDSADMRDKYAVQLGWYKRVLERILKKPVKECYLYLFYRHEELLVEV